MVLSLHSSGKYLSKEWHRKREQALIDRRLFSAAELTWLEVEAHEGRGVLDPETYKLETQPFDESNVFGRTNIRRVDVRDRPTTGGQTREGD